MLNEYDRESFFEQVKPHSGYRLAYCIGTTFSLELDCLIELALRTSNGDKSLEDVSTFEALDAIEDFTAKSVLFVQNCRIKELPIEHLEKGTSKKAKLYSLLDSSVEQVSPISIDSAFHPKVWLLKYDCQGEGEPLYKLLVMSKNLTKSLHWDISACLVGREDVGKGNGNGNSKIRAFLDEFTSGSGSLKKSKKNQELLKQAKLDLEKVHFGLPKSIGAKEVEFLFRWGSRGSCGSIKELKEFKKVLVVSPFLSEATLREMESHKDAILVTGEKNLEQVKRVPGLADKTFVLNSNSDGLRLHAKMYLGLSDDTCHLWVGSQNFTTAAWFGENTEAMLRFKLPKVAFENFKKDFLFSEKDIPHNWITRFSDYICVEPDAIDATTKDHGNKLNLARQILSTSELSLSLSGNKLVLGLKGDFSRFPPEVKGSIQVVGANEVVCLEDLLKGQLTLTKFKKSELSSFVSIHLILGASKVSFCTVAISDISRNSRYKSLFAELVKDWDGFWDYLAVVLNLPEKGFKTPERETNGAVGRDRNVLKFENKRGRRPGYIEPLLLCGPPTAELVEKIDRALVAIPNAEAAAEDKEFLLFWRQYKLAFAEFKKHG